MRAVWRPAAHGAGRHMRRGAVQQRHDWQRCTVQGVKTSVGLLHGRSVGRQHEMEETSVGWRHGRSVGRRHGMDETGVGTPHERSVGGPHEMDGVKWRGMGSVGAACRMGMHKWR